MNEATIKKAIAANQTIKPNRIRAALKPIKHKEEDEQAIVVEWAHWAYKHHSDKFPLLRLLHCSLNGVKLSKMQAIRAKRQGMLSGVLDLFLPVRRGGYAGLYIEMKWGKNTTTPNQKTYKADVESQGFLAKVCYSAKEAIEVIQKYYGVTL